MNMDAICLAILAAAICLKWWQRTIWRSPAI